MRFINLGEINLAVQLPAPELQPLLNSSFQGQDDRSYLSTINPLNHILFFAGCELDVFAADPDLNCGNRHFQSTGCSPG